jgi:hypothetical protein
MRLQTATLGGMKLMTVGSLTKKLRVMTIIGVHNSGRMDAQHKPLLHHAQDDAPLKIWLSLKN